MNILRSIKKRYISIKKFLINQDSKTWCFLPYGDDFTGNIKAIFESVRHTTITKVIFTKSRSFDKYRSQSVIIINNLDHKYFFRSSILICDQMLDLYHSQMSLYLERVTILNVWHGIPIKKMFMASQKPCSPYIGKEKDQFNIIASSKQDALAMSECFDLPLNRVHITGLPRIDLLQTTSLDCIQSEQVNLQAILKGKPFILFAPTWRQNTNDYYQFSSSELDHIDRFLKENDCILGVREHFHQRNSFYYQQLEEVGAINVGNTLFKNIETLIKSAILLITDYSSCHFDFLHLNKPSISFAFDYERYKFKERGFLYEIEEVFNNNVFFNFHDVISQCKAIMVDQKVSNQHQSDLKNKFFLYNDNNNTKRTLTLIENLINEKLKI